MEYTNVKEGLFLKRPNRFIALVLIEGKEEVCHVKNTGRCKELLIPGETKVYVVDHGTHLSRKTRYSLIQVVKQGRHINMDSQAPNQVALEWILKGGLFCHVDYVKREQVYGSSRIDLYVEADGKQNFIEVKGVTLEEENIAKFPDAPTLRGVKHIYELCNALEAGYEAFILFVIQMENIHCFMPNNKTHPEFGEALRYAEKKGVHILAVESKVGIGTLKIHDFVPIELE